MQKFARHEIVHSIQLTEKAFTDEHPSKEHVAGVVYFPRQQFACIYMGGKGLEIAKLGDWIVCEPDGQLTVMDDAYFRKHYTCVESPHDNLL